MNKKLFYYGSLINIFAAGFFFYELIFEINCTAFSAFSMNIALALFNIINYNDSE